MLTRSALSLASYHLHGTPQYTCTLQVSLQSTHNASTTAPPSPKPSLLITPHATCDPLKEDTVLSEALFLLFSIYSTSSIRSVFKNRKCIEQPVSIFRGHPVVETLYL